MLGAAGDTTMVTSNAAVDVSVAEPWMPVVGSVAMIVAVPGTPAVASPFDPAALEMLALDPDVVHVALWVMSMVVVLVVAGALYLRMVARRPAVQEDRTRRDTWRMPPVALLERPTWSRGRTLTMYLMYGYVFLAVALLLVKAIELGLHH